MCGERVDLLRGEKERKQWSIPTLTKGVGGGILSGFTHYPHHLILNSVPSATENREIPIFPNTKETKIENTSRLLLLRRLASRRSALTLGVLPASRPVLGPGVGRRCRLSGCRA